MTPDEIAQQIQKERESALKSFPFTLIETTEEEALAEWQELKSAGQGYPVIFGGDDEGDHFGHLLMQFGPRRRGAPPQPSFEATLQAAAAIDLPADLAKLRKKESEATLAILKETLRASTKPASVFTRITRTTAGITHVSTGEETIAEMMMADHEDPRLEIGPRYSI